MIILFVNAICAVLIAFIGIRFLASFEVAFIGTSLVIYSSYRAIAKKINAIKSVESSKKNADSSKMAESVDFVESSDSVCFSKMADSSKCVESSDSMESSGESPKWHKQNLQDDSSGDSSDSKNKTSQDSSDVSSDFRVPIKERFLLGMGLSLGILRLLSYAFIFIGGIVLVDNQLFFIIPFFGGIALSSLAFVLNAIVKSNNI